MSHICDSCHINPSTQRCTGCSQAWYCSRPCQRADWLLHKFDCNTPHAPSTADRLWVACTHNRAPADLQTCLDYGFQRAFTRENRAMLLGVYQELKDRYHVSSKTVDRWRMRGGREMLAREIRDVYEGTLEGERGVFYEWFVEHQYVLDGKTAEEWDERQAKRDLDAQISRAGWGYSGGEPAAEMDCINDGIEKLPRDKRDCQYFAGSLLTSVYQVPEVCDTTWTTFGFCACNMDKDGVGLGRIYRKLLERTTFDELVKAYTSSQMYALLASKDLNQELDEQYPLVKDILRLSPNTNLSVWDLKRFVLQKKTLDPKSPNFLLPLAPAAYSDYGFANCDSPDDTDHLRDVYMYMFQLACRPNMPGPLELHQACIENRLYEHMKGLIKLNDKAKHMYKQLMKNSYEPGLAVWPAGVAIYPGSTEEVGVVDGDFALPQEKSAPADKTDKPEPTLNAVDNSSPAVVINKSASVITEVEVFSVPVVVDAPVVEESSVLDVVEEASAPSTDEDATAVEEACVSPAPVADIPVADEPSTQAVEDAVTPSVTAEEPLAAATEEIAAPVVVAEQATVEESPPSTVEGSIIEESSTAADEDVAAPLPAEQAVVEESLPSAIEEPVANERSIPAADEVTTLPVADETKVELVSTSTIEESVIEEESTPAVQEVVAPPPAIAETIAEESAPILIIEEPVVKEKLTPVVDKVTAPLSVVEGVTVEEPAVEEKVTEAVEELDIPLPVVDVQESADESASPPASKTPGVEVRSAPASAADKVAALVTVAGETDTVAEDQVVKELVEELSQPVVTIEDSTVPPVVIAAPTPTFVAKSSTPAIVKDTAPATPVNDISPPQVAANKGPPTQAAGNESLPQAAENPTAKNNEAQQPATPPSATETVSHSRWNVFSGSASLLKRAFHF